MTAKELKLLVDSLLELEGETAEVAFIEPGRDGDSESLHRVEAKLTRNNGLVALMIWRAY